MVDAKYKLGVDRQVFKQVAKTLVRIIASCLILPLVIAFNLLARVAGKQRAFPFFAQSLSLVPGNFGVYVRWSFYHWVLARCGRDAVIGFGTLLVDPSTLIGDTVYIGSYCVIGVATLEDDVLLGSNVSIINGNRQHGIERLDVPIREQTGRFPRVTVGRDSWIGDRSIVMANIGRQCVIGAGSVVTKPVPDSAIVAGNPARVIRMRTATANSSIENSSSNQETLKERDIIECAE